MTNDAKNTNRLLELVNELKQELSDAYSILGTQTEELTLLLKRLDALEELIEREIGDRK